MDTEVNRFLIEFHRRQRAQLIQPVSGWTRLVEWVKSLGLAPSLSYGSAIAAIALVAFMGLSQQVQVTHVDGGYKFSLLTPGHDPEMAMIPAFTDAGEEDFRAHDFRAPGPRRRRPVSSWPIPIPAMTRPPRSRLELRGLLFPAALVLAALSISAPLRADDVFQSLDQELSALFDKTKGSVVQGAIGRRRRHALRHRVLLRQQRHGADVLLRHRRQHRGQCHGQRRVRRRPHRRQRPAQRPRRAAGREPPAAPRCRWASRPT